MLQQSRKLAKSKVFKLVLYLLIAAFALSGASAGFMMDFSDNYIVKVNGEKIYPQEVQRRYQLIARNLLAEGINFSEEQLAAMGVSQQEVLNSMIQEKLLRNELKNLSLSIGDDEIARQITNAPLFQKDGVFDREAFQVFLYQRGLRETEYTNTLRNELSTNMLMSVLLTGNPLINTVKETALEKAAEARSFEIAIIPNNLKTYIGNPTDKELEAFYFENSFMFEVPEQRAIAYIEFKNEKGKEAATFDQIAKIEDGVAGGSTLAELAKALGLELQIAEKITSDANAFSEKFLQTVLSTEEGETSGVVEDEEEDMYFVITMTEVKESYIPELEEVKADAIREFKADESRKLTREFANQVYNEAKAKDDLAKISQKYGLKTTKKTGIKREDYDKVGFAMLQDGFAAEKGNVLGVYDSVTGGYEVAALADIDKEELSEIDRVKQSDRLRKELEAEILAQYLTYLQTKYPVKQNPSFEEAAR